MILEVLTPDEVLFKGEVSQVILPGLNGFFGILNNHAPVIAALKSGPITVDQIVSDNEETNHKLNLEFKGNAKFNFDVNGGVVEVSNNKILVLAE